MTTSWITGAHGFLGRHLAIYLNSQGHCVLGVGHGTWSAQEAALSGIRFWINGEIDWSNLEQLADHSGLPDFVFHLAGGASVAASVQSPAEDFERTTATTVRVLDWIRRRSPRAKVVVASSAAVYGAGHEHPIEEDAPLNPASPYGAHKQMMEQSCSVFGLQYGVSTAVVRLFSLYGPGLRKQLIHDLCQRIARGDVVLDLCGAGGEQRDWLHVDDAVRYLVAATSIATPSAPVVNGCTQVATSVADVVTLVVAAWERPISVAFTGAARVGDPPYLVGSSARARTFGLCHSVNVADGIPAVVRSYRAVYGLL